MTGKRWVIAEGREIVMEVRATGRTKALKEAQDVLGGHTQTTGSFTRVLVGAGSHGPLRAWEPDEFAGWFDSNRKDPDR